MFSRIVLSRLVVTLRQMPIKESYHKASGNASQKCPPIVSISYAFGNPLQPYFQSRGRYVEIFSDSFPLTI